MRATPTSAATPATRDARRRARAGDGPGLRSSHAAPRSTPYPKALRPAFVPAPVDRSGRPVARSAAVDEHPAPTAASAPTQTTTDSSTDHRALDLPIMLPRPPC